MKNYFLFGIFVCFSIALFAGCAKKELTAEEALAIISKKPAGRLTRTVQKVIEAKSIDPSLKIVLEKMQAAGYASIKEVSGSYRVAPSEKLGPFVITEDADSVIVKLADIVADKVTGVTRKGDEADAVYTNRLVTNQLAEEVFAPVSNPSPGPNHMTLRWADGKWN